MSTRCIDEQNAYRNEFARLLRNYVQARDEILTFTTDFGCNTPAGQSLGEAVHIYSRPGASREFVHEMMDDGHIDYVIGLWNPFVKNVFGTLEEANSYLSEYSVGDGRDVIYETGKIGGIDVFSMYTKDEVLRILKEKETEQ